MTEFVGLLLVLPLLAAYRLRLLGFETIAVTLALLPGGPGRVIRRAWYCRTLASCGPKLSIEFGSVIRTPRARVGRSVAIGPYNWFGWVDLGDYFLSADHVSIPSGHAQHGYTRLDLPMQQQAGEMRCVKVGPDVWVGASATIINDVAPHSIVSSGAVVTKTFGAYDILAGVPARAIGNRMERSRTVALAR